MTTSLTDYHDAELNRLRVVIDNDASDRATVIRVEILSRLWVLTCAINEHGLLIHDSDLHYHSRLWHGAISVTDDDGNKIADERTITDIRTAIEDMERQHLTRMNALWHDDFLASLGWNIKDTWDTWDSFDLGEAMVKQKLRADLENQTPRSKCYNIDLDVSKAEEVLLHRRILAECADADKHPVVHARFFGYFDSQEDKLPAVGSSRTEKGNPGASVASNSRGSTKDTQFSFSPSGMSGIDLMVGSGSVHVPKHYSVHHPVVQMVLFATVLSDDFDHKYFMMPKAALNIKKKLPWFYIVYGDGSVVAKAHVSKFHTGVVCFSKHPNANEVFLGYTSATYRLDERTSTLLNSSHFSEERHGSKMYALVTPRSSMSCDVGTVALCLWLDSGASSDMVGDSTILINLRDLSTGRVIITADGSRLAVAKVGDIQTPDIRIQDVFYVPGLQMNLVSVRQLAKSKVVTTFYENHAKLCLEGEQIGGAVVDDTVSLYKLRYLH